MAKDETIDFLVIGAPKSGTTSLFEYLRQHPEISLPPDKEAPYFNNDEVYHSVAWPDYVRRTFPERERRKRSGTITPHYMFPVTSASPDAGHDEYTVPRRIHERLPSVRLIAILRDPVERAYSHHMQEARRGFEGRSFAEAIDELIQPAALARYRCEFSTTDCYVTLGEYGRILSAYYETFSSDQIMVLFTEALARDPMRALQSIYSFLDVDLDVSHRNLGRRYNVSAAELKVSRVSPATLVRLASSNPLARAMWHSLSDARQNSLLGRYRRLDFRFSAWNRRGAVANRRSDEDIAALERLREHYAPDGQRLSALLGHAPPWEARQEKSP